MDNKNKAFLMALREIALQFVAAIEDRLDIPFDRSGLAKRRAKMDQSTLEAKS